MTAPVAHARPVTPRDLWLVGLLSVVTLGLYNLYLVYAWARELNHLAGQLRHSPPIVLLVSVLTLGVGASVFESVYAFDLARLAEAGGRPLRTPGLPGVVVALEVAAVVFSLTGVGLIIGLPAGVAASVLLQRELNGWGGA